MTGKIRCAALLLALLLTAAAAVTACADRSADQNAGLSRAEVAEIVRMELSAAPPPAAATPATTATITSADVEEAINRAIGELPRPEPRLSRNEVEEIIRAALADITSPPPGLTEDEAWRIARDAVASIPPRSAPADYTQFFVESAIARYETRGLEATLAHYNSPQSVDGQWYVFIIDENDRVIGHPDPERLGLDLNGWVGTDANGYEFGPEMLAATEDGKWVSYVYRNPESGGIGSGKFELKNVWVERRDGLLFASGWYIDADEFTQRLVSIAVDHFRDGGLSATVAYFASPGSALAGLEAAIDYYNTAETLDGKWSAFIGDPSGKIVAHSDPSMIGRGTQELSSSEPFDATEDGVWVTSESLRLFMAEYDGFVFGSGWSREE